MSILGPKQNSIPFVAGLASYAVLLAIFGLKSAGPMVGFALAASALISLVLFPILRIEFAKGQHVRLLVLAVFGVMFGVYAFGHM